MQVVGRLSPNIAWQPRIVTLPCAPDTNKFRVPILQIRHQASMTTPPILRRQCVLCHMAALNNESFSGTWVADMKPGEEELR
jgi:hypothetical protein